MKKIVFTCFIIVLTVTAIAQTNDEANFGDRLYNKIFDEDFVERKPVFPYTRDSLQNFYLSHFNGFDSLITKAIDNGDTAKYIRVHFEFVLDENGIAYEPKFKYIGSTKYAGGSGDKKLKYFDALRPYFQQAIKEMLMKMPAWRPALQNNKRVNCRKDDYFQLWVGILPPAN